MRRTARAPLARLASGVAVAAVGMVALGCLRGPGRLTVVHRLVDETPARLLDPVAVTDTVPVLQWRFSESEALAEWRLNDLVSLGVGPEGAVLRCTTADPKMSCRPGVAAERVGRVEVELAGLDRGRVQLFWRRAGEPDDRFHRMEASAEEARSGVLLFPVETDPEWSGVIEFLRLDPGSTPDLELTLSRVTLAQVHTDPDALRSVVGRPWRVDLGHEVRSAVVATAGEPLQWDVVVPRGGRLRLGYGVTPRARVPWRFRVAATGADGVRRVLLATRVEGDTGPEAGRWRDVEVDLHGLAGRRAALSLEAETVEPYDGFAGLPCWSSPRVVAETSATTRPNVVLISVDTLRADRLSGYGYERETTPRIDGLAEQGGVVFLNTISPSPWTKPAHVSLFTGQDALTHGVNYNGRVPTDGSLLAEVLRRAGYATVAVTGGVFLHPRWGFEEGFDAFSYWSDEDKEAELREGVAAVRALLERGPTEPFFLFLHTYETHAPFRVRQPFFDRLGGGPGRLPETAFFTTRKADAGPEGGYQRRHQLVLRRSHRAEDAPVPVGDAELADVSTAYDSGVAYADDLLGALIGELRSSELGARTIVVLTSDHGEMLGEKGLSSHSCLYDPVLRVPLVIWPAASRPGRVSVAQQVRLIDVVPTILELVGVPAEHPVDGVSLVPLMAGGQAEVPDEAWSYGGATNYGLAVRLDNHLKYIFNNTAWAREGHVEELYHLSADPEEESNRVSETSPGAGLRRRAAEVMERGLRGWRIRLSNATGTALTADVRCAELGRANLKTWTMPAGRARWLGRHTARLEVRPGDSYTVHVETRHPGALAVELTGRGLELGRLDLPADAVTEPSGLVLDGRQWLQVGELGPEGRTGVLVGWSGRAEAAVVVSGEDAELERRLRALGYIE